MVWIPIFFKIHELVLTIKYLKKENLTDETGHCSFDSWIVSLSDTGEVFKFKERFIKGRLFEIELYLSCSWKEFGDIEIESERGIEEEEFVLCLLGGEAEGEFSV